MNLSEKLRKLAAGLQDGADPILAEAEDSEPVFELVLQAVASSAVSLESAADLLDKAGISGLLSVSDIEGLGEWAAELDSSGDPELQKKASVLDELLLTLAAPKNAIAQIKANTEDELARLRAKYHSQRREELYSGPKEELQKQRHAAESVKAVEKAVTKRRPMQEPLQTRYSPDMPGTPMIRISDGVYQCSVTGKIYNYYTGYTTAKGTQIPGTSVQRQTELNDPMRGHTMFTTRENIMARFTALNDESTLKKLAGIFGGPEESVNPQFEEVIEKMTDLQEQIGKLNPEMKGPALDAVIAALSKQREVTPSIPEETPSPELKTKKPSEPFFQADDGEAMKAAAAKVSKLKRQAADIIKELTPGEDAPVPFDDKEVETAAWNNDEYERIVEYLRDNEPAAYQQLTMPGAGFNVVPGDAEGDSSHPWWASEDATNLVTMLKEEHPEALGKPKSEEDSDAGQFE